MQLGADATADASPTGFCISEEDEEDRVCREADGCQEVFSWSHQVVGAALDFQLSVVLSTTLTGIFSLLYS